jgi:CRP-like cAMP-binding protein
MPPPTEAEFSRNRLLTTVHLAELNRFAELFRVQEFPNGHVVSEPGEPITQAIFPLDSVFSVVAATSDGDQVEAGMIGHEGVVGVAPFLGTDATLLRTMCQIPGQALVADTGSLLARADGALLTAARRYALSFMTMASQGAACNRLHAIEQRGARWLLMVNDRVDRNPFELTHEFFSIMLGATRPTTTHAAARLRRLGAIEYRRGRVTILDRPLLETIACECYETITTEYERALRTTLRRTPAGSTTTAFP